MAGSREFCRPKHTSIETLSLGFLNELTVIIPFIAHDILWKDLLRDLQPLPAGAEILLVGPDKPEPEILALATRNLIATVRYVESPRGRAVQMNSGARAARGSYFWFLHADAKVPRPALYALATDLQREPNAVHYFSLQYLNDGPRLMTVTSILANLRAHYLGIPFGDQGFAVSRGTFYRLGGYQENLLYGEDQVLIWEARRKRVALNALPASIFTSARSYESSGWGQLTSKRAAQTIKLAAHQWLRLFMQRLVE
jgi:Glycosyl transferase family 2